MSPRTSNCCDAARVTPARSQSSVPDATELARAGALSAPMRSWLLQLDGLVVPGGVELSSPYLVRSLMFCTAVTDQRA